MGNFFQDLKFGVRLLRKDKGFTFTILATLTICFTANVAVFSIVDSVVFKPLPFPQSEQLVFMYNSYPNVGVKRAATGVPDYFDRLRDVSVFEEQALYNQSGITLGEKGSVMRAQCLNVTPSFFRLLRAQPILGRTFLDEEGEIGNERHVVLSYSLWQELYGGDTGVLEKKLRIYGNEYLIVGIMPRQFLFQDPEIRLWRPLAFTPEQKQARHSNNWQMIGRLKPGATVQQAQSQIDALNAANMERFSQWRQILTNAGFHTVALRYQDDVVRDIKDTLYLLWGGVLFVMVIGVVNIASLVLARSNIRLKEVAIRLAMGARPGRVARQLITENVLMTACSAALALLLGSWCLQAFAKLGIHQIPRGSEIAMHGTAVVFTLGLALLSGIAIALIPIGHALNVDWTLLFRGEGRTGTSSRSVRLLRRSLVAAQVAFALVLLMGAGLLLASFRQVLAVKTGFVAENVLTGSVTLPSSRYKDAVAQRSFFQEALERIRAVPGVTAAGATNIIPLSGNSSDSVILAEGYVMKPGESMISPNKTTVTTGYFEALRIPLISGRYFDQRDGAEKQPAIIIDERLAQKFWPQGDPVGRRMWQPSNAEDLIKPGKDARWFTVIGVVKSIKLRALVDPDERVGAYYFPYTQNPATAMTLAVRSTTDPASLAMPIRNIILELDPELPLYDVRTMQERLEQSLVSRRSPMLLSSGFGIVALLLVVVGVYGMLTYTVNLRSKEIGIRMALGGTAQAIFKLVLREGLFIIGLGSLAGMAGTLAMGRYVESKLFGVRPLNPTVLLSSGMLLVLTAMAACLLPARRAARIDPVDALRQE
jgi:predicted permease